MNILLTGSIAYDYLMSFPGYFKDHILPGQLESISLSFLVDSMVRRRGGVAPNIAYTLALLGEKPKIMATVGEDFEEYRTWLEDKGVDTGYIRTINGEYTASFFANTDQSNAQIASFYTGAMAYASELSLADIPAGAIDLVVVSPNDPKAMEKTVKECQVLGIPYLYDPSQQLARISQQDILNGVSKADSLFVNDYEFGLLQKHTGLSAEHLLSSIRFVVVTEGEKGASIHVGGEKFHINSVQPQTIADPTGVGDAFRGGFLKGYSLGFDWQTCGQMGALAATYCLEQKGTQTHSYTRQEFVTRYRDNFDDNSLLDVLIK